MRITVDRDELKAALAVPVQIASKSSVVDFRSIKITATDTVTIEATDLVTNVKQTLKSAFVEKSGSFLLPAKKLDSVVKVLPDANVSIDIQDGKATITSGSVVFSSTAFNPNDFPAFQNIAPTCNAKIDLASFNRLAKAILPAVSKQSTSMSVLEGVHVEIGDGLFSVTGTDGYRVHKGTAAAETDGACNAVVPPSALVHILSVAFGSVEIAANERHVQFSSDGQTISTVVVEGSFPNVNQILKSNYPVRATFDAQLLKSSIKRASAISEGDAVYVDIANNVAEITCSTDAEKFSETLPCVCEEKISIAQNPTYLAAAISAIDSCDVIFETNEKQEIVHLLGDQIECCSIGVRR